MRKGNCYAVSEAAWHILGGTKSGWTPMRLKVNPQDAECHWFLKHRDGAILDLSVRQFKTPPDYSKAVGSGFLPTPSGQPSKAAQKMIERMTWDG